MAICNCNSTLSNTGTASCKTVMSTTRKLVLVPYIADDGTQNSIDPTDTFDDAFFSALVNNSDTSKRWYPLPLIENVDDVRTEPEYFTFASDRKIFVGDGTRTFTAVMPQESTELLSRLESFMCTKVGAYLIGEDGEITGQISSDGTELFPVLIQDNTLYFGLTKSKPKEPQMLTITFEFSDAIRDSQLRIIPAADITANVLLLDGLQTIQAVVSADSQTGFTVTLTTATASATSGIPVRGFLAADLKLYNNTDDPGHAAAIALTLVSETDGVYVFTHASQTASDVMELELAPAKTGWALDSTTWTI